MWKLALRNVLRQKVRTTMTLVAIVFGVVGMILSGGFVEDVFVQLGEAMIHSQSGHLQVSRAGFYEKGARNPDRYLIGNQDPVRRALAAQPVVLDVMARLNFSGLINNGRTDLSIIGEGVEPDKEARLGSYLMITAGRQLADKDRFGLLLGQGVAHALKLRPGDRTTLVLNTSEGALNSLDFEVVGVFQSFSKEYDARAVRISLTAAQELLNTPGANSIVVSLRQTRDTATAARTLKEQLGPGGYELKTWVELNDFYEKTVALYQRQFSVLQLIILMMVLLSVVNSVNMSTFERVGEFGTMMALGNRSPYVFRLVVAENVLLGLVGAILGVALGGLLAWGISAVGIPMPPPPNSNLAYTAYIRVVPSIMAVAALVGFTATMGAALLPARRVSGIAVVEALRQNV